MESLRAESGQICPVSQRIIHVLVAPQRSLQPPNIEAVRRLQSTDLSQLDTEADLASRVLAVIAVESIRADRFFAAPRHIARIRVSPQRPDAPQSEFALLGDHDAHALEDAEDVFHDLHGRGRRHCGRVHGSLVDVNAEVLG